MFEIKINRGWIKGGEIYWVDVWSPYCPPEYAWNAAGANFVGTLLEITIYPNIGEVRTERPSQFEHSPEILEAWNRIVGREGDAEFITNLLRDHKLWIVWKK